MKNERIFFIESQMVGPITQSLINAGNEGKNIVDVAIDAVRFGCKSSHVRRALREAAPVFGVSDDELDGYLNIAAKSGNAREVNKIRG